MGPTKISRSVNKITIKGYDHQLYVDPPSFTKKRKTTYLDAKWSKDELMHFYEAYHRRGKDWKKIRAAVGHKSSDMVKALYSVHRTLLSLPKCKTTAMGFIALVTGDCNVLVISEGNDSQDGEAGTWNQATNCIGHESEAAICDSQLPSNLILNCTAKVLAIKRLADSQHPPANMVGVLERFTSLLRPRNLAIYKDKRDISPS